MTTFKPLLQSSAFALIVSAPAAFADVTANDVWTQWKTYMTQGGQTMSVGSEEMSGDTLTITDLQVAMDMPDGGMNSTISELTFKENGDGTVLITLPPEYPMSVTMRPEGQNEGVMNLVVRQDNVTVVASGTPDAIAYAVAGQELTVELESLEMTGEDQVDMGFTITFGGIAGNYSLASGDPMTFTSAANAATLSVEINASDPNGNGEMTLSAEASNLSTSSSGSMPSVASYGDLPAMLAAGFMANGTLNYGAASYDMQFSENADDFAMTGSAESGGLDFALSPEGISYETRSAGVDVALSGSAIPLPEIAVQLAEAGFGLTMPLAKSDTPQDAGLLVRLVGLSVGEDIWGMIDPGGALPHDPATLIVDLAGTANWLIDITAPDAEQQMQMGMPGQIHTLDIQELQVTIAGADLSGTGAFTFDNNDLMTWGGMPAPDGAVDLKLNGANGLMDKLVQMGLLPQDQAMGARMMMGMFARPGEGPDSLVSRIEVKADGSVFANGMQIK